MEKQITFSTAVKEEIVSGVELSKERLLALLSAYIRINGVISFVNKEVAVILKSENAKIIKFIYKSLKEYFPSTPMELDYKKKSNNKKKTTYLLKIENAEELLDELSVSYLEGKISKEIVYDDEGAGSFLLNILWIIFGVIEMAITNALIGVVLCITIIGIPWGKQYFKIAKLSLMPFGARVEREHIL